jgi:hypothetical protein
MNLQKVQDASAGKGFFNEVHRKLFRFLTSKSAISTLTSPGRIWVKIDKHSAIKKLNGKSWNMQKQTGQCAKGFALFTIGLLHFLADFSSSRS